LDISIDIQGYSEVNRDFLKQHQRQAIQEATARMDRHSKTIWGTSQVTSNWRDINCPKEIELLLRLQNQRHFGQAESEGTPFTTPRMKHKFNWSASTCEAELVLEGDYTDEELTGFRLLPQYWGQILGSFFCGGVSPSRQKVKVLHSRLQE
jgi:hypothetical protein